MQRALTTVFLLGLLLASVAAFALTEHLKLVKSPVYATHVTKVFSPANCCGVNRAEVAFRLRKPETLTLTIVDSSGRDVATLGAGVKARREVTFHWDGRTDSGKAARDASGYQPKIEFADGRTILMPNKITLDSTPPRVLSASVGTGRLVVGDHRSVTIRYVLDGRARAAVFLGKRRVIFSRHLQPQGVVKWNGWNGERFGSRVPPGRYVLEVAAYDLAGNVTPASGRKRVVVQIEAHR